MMQVSVALMERYINKQTDIKIKIQQKCKVIKAIFEESLGGSVVLIKKNC